MTVLFLLILFWSVFFILIIPILYKILQWNYSYWRRKNVEGPPPRMLLGNMTELFTIKHHMGAHFKLLYEKTKHLPYAGIYLLHRPAIIINDLNLIKLVLAKDFIHFTDHGFYFDKKTQPIINHLFNVNGAKWKAIRNKLSPAFTPSKIKHMIEIMIKCGDEMTKYLNKFAEDNVEVDVKDTVSKFTMDVILSSAFGVENNSFENPDAEFRTMGKKVFEVTTKRKIKMFIALFIPELHKIINGLVIDKEITDFFAKTIEKIVKYREENNVIKNDLLQFLMKLKNDNISDDYNYIDRLPMKENETLDVQLSMLEMTAQAFGFFVGGFETASTSLGFLFYELARHPNIQSKLIDEIDRILRAHEGKLSYEALGEMTYMESVIEETLRLYPPVPQLFRICTKQYIIPNTDVVIEEGTPVVISTLGIQSDDKIYPNPELFDPDRFSTKGKASRSNFSFLTFGEGPRICIGMPLALLQMRVALVSILKDYEVSIGQKKERTLEVINKSMIMAPRDMILRVKKRIK